MAAQIINFNKAKKTKARAQKETKAAENRRLFGRTKAEKQSETLQKLRAEQRHLGHQLSKDDSTL